jgi:ribonuclease J
MIEIIPIGGYSEIGRNCTLIKYKSEAVMIDLGLHLDNYIRITEDEDFARSLSRNTLIREEAIPDLFGIDEMKFLKAVIIGHGHLDHVGAVPFYADMLKVPIHGTEFTMQVLKVLIEDKKKRLPEIISHPVNSRFRVSKNLSIELINVTHSTPQTSIVVVHTPEGCVVYANDFKFDHKPMLGQVTNFEALKKLKNVKALIMNCLYTERKGRTPSEQEAVEKLEELLLSEDFTGRNIITTTFSSHVSRLRTLAVLAKRIGRKPVFIGRSMAKYIDAAKTTGLVDLEKEAEFVRFGSTLEKYFHAHPQTTDKMFIVTGHQAEPKAILSRLAHSNIFPFKKKDVVIFSSSTIPNELNYRNKDALDAALKSKGIVVHNNMHVSGHASEEDQEELIKILKPKNIIPTHGDPRMMKHQEKLALKLGYKKTDVHILENFSRIYV